MTHDPAAIPPALTEAWDRIWKAANAKIDAGTFDRAAWADLVREVTELGKHDRRLGNLEPALTLGFRMRFVTGATLKATLDAIAAHRPLPELPAAPPAFRPLSPERAARFIGDADDIIIDAKPVKASVERLYSPDQPRDDHGRFGEGGSADGSGGAGGHGGNSRERERIIDEATKNVEHGLAQGGFSFRPPADVPKDGFMVALPPGANRGAVFDMHSEQLGKGELHASVRRWTAREMSAIEHTPNHYLGGWVSEGKVFLDVSERFEPHDRAAAIAAGRERDQIAIFDLAAHARGEDGEIKTGGTGGVTSTSVMATLATMTPAPPSAEPGKREQILPPSREYTPKQVADHVVEYVEKYRAEHNLPPLKP